VSEPGGVRPAGQLSDQLRSGLEGAASRHRERRRMLSAGCAAHRATIDESPSSARASTDEIPRVGARRGTALAKRCADIDADRLASRWRPGVPPLTPGRPFSALILALRRLQNLLVCTPCTGRARKTCRSSSRRVARLPAETHPERVASALPRRAPKWLAGCWRGAIEQVAVAVTGTALHPEASMSRVVEFARCTGESADFPRYPGGST
jgi:hypothetical protein